MSKPEVNTPAVKQHGDFIKDQLGTLLMEITRCQAIIAQLQAENMTLKEELAKK